MDKERAKHWHAVISKDQEALSALRNYAANRGVPQPIKDLVQEATNKFTFVLGRLDCIVAGRELEGGHKAFAAICETVIKTIDIYYPPARRVASEIQGEQNQQKVQNGLKAIFDARLNVRRMQQELYKEIENRGNGRGNGDGSGHGKGK